MGMVIYDQWPYMTIVDILEMWFTAFPEGIKIDGLLFEESREEQAILQEASWNVGTLEYWAK